MMTNRRYQRWGQVEAKRRRRCRSKRRCQSHEATVVAAADIERKFGDVVYPYPCVRCDGGWHLTTSDGTNRKTPSSGDAYSR
jgi:hypothetical protein